MKLFYSAASPFVRKVRICALAAGLDAQITRVGTDPWESPADLLAMNPLSKVPCLVTEDGAALFDSGVICEYLDHVGDGSLFPPAGAARWRALKQQALADGILDAGVLRRRDMLRPAETARTAAMERQKGIVQRGLDALEAEKLADHLDIGTISVACALGWLDLRFPAEDWREGRPKLAAWFTKIGKHPEVAQTAPPPG